jgi:hypothetical protein
MMIRILPNVLLPLVHLPFYKIPFRVSLPPLSKSTGAGAYEIFAHFRPTDFPQSFTYEEQIRLFPS